MPRCVGPGNDEPCPGTEPCMDRVGQGDDFMCAPCANIRDSRRRTLKIRQSTLAYINGLLLSKPANTIKSQVLEATKLNELVDAKTHLINAAGAFDDMRDEFLQKKSTGRKENHLDDIFDMIETLKSKGVSLNIKPKVDKSNATTTPAVKVNEPQTVQCSNVQLVVSLPAIGEVDETKLKSTSKSCQEDSGVSCSTQADMQTDKPIVHNELLCFMTHQMKQLPADTLVKLCEDFYSEQNVTEAKNIVYRLSNKQNRRNVKHTGSNKTRNNLLDMYKLLQEEEPDNAPQYAAIDLSNMPPVSCRNVDTLHLLREIAEIKSSVSLLSMGHRDLTQIVRTQLPLAPKEKKREDMHANNATASPSNFHPNVDHHSSDTETDTEAGTDDSSVPPSIEPPSSTHPTRTPTATRTDKLETDKSCRYNNDTLATRVFTNSQQKAQKTRRDRHHGHQSKTSARDLVIHGKGEPSLSMPARTNKQSKPNRTCTGLFVTRLQRRTTPEQLERQLYLASGYKIKAEKLETRHDSYSSFYIRADRTLRDALMDPDVWPANSMVRLFFE